MLHQAPLLKHLLMRAGCLLLGLTAAFTAAFALQPETAPGAEYASLLTWPWNAVWLGLLCVGMALYPLRQQTPDRQTANPFDKVFDNLPVPMAIMHMRDVVFVSANQEFQRLTRLSLDDIVGKTHEQVGFDVEPAEQQRFYACILAQERVRDYELTVRFFGLERVLLISSEHISFNGEACLLGSFQNITERKHAEERFAKAFHANPISMTIISRRNNRIIETNPSTLKLTGRTLAEMQGKTLREINVGITQEIWQEIRAQLLATGTLSDYEFKVNYQGREHVLLACAEHIDFNGEPCILWSQQDITERKLAEERFAKAFYANPLPMCINRASDLRFIAVNDSILRFTGFNREEMLGKTRREIGLVTDEATEQAILEQLQTHGSLRDFETTVKLKGVNRTFLVSVEFIVLDGERCSLWTTQDITERKRAEERFSKAFFKNPAPMCISRFADNRHLVVNESYEQLTGYSQAELAGKNAAELGFVIDPDSAARFQQTLLSTKSVRNFELEVKYRMGWRTVLVSAELLPLEGELSILWSLLDITERKQAEERFTKAFTANLLPMCILRFNSLEILHANEIFLRRTRRSLAEVSGKAPLEIGFGIDVAKINAITELLRATGSVQNYELHTSYQGRDVYFLTSAECMTLAGELCVLWSFQDITARVRAEKKFTRLFQSNPCELWICRLADHQVIEVNQQWEKDTGYTRAEVLGRTPAELGLRVSLAAIDQVYEIIQRKGAVHGLEFEYQDRFGQRSWGVCSGELLEIEGEPCVLWANQDITERKRAEEALRESELRYRRLVEDQLDFLVRWSPDGTRTFVNDSYCRFFGLQPAEAIGTSWFDLAALADDDPIRQKLAGLSSETPIVEWEHQCPAPDGSLAWTHWINRAFFDETGRVSEFQSVGRDITARKQAEERFAKAFYDNAVPMSIVRAEEDIIVEVNRAYHALTGYSREEAIGMTCTQVGFQFSAADYQQALAEMRSTGQFKTIEVAAVFKTGAKILLSSASLISFNGVECVLWSEQDITERKQAEAALQASETKFRTLAETSQAAIFITDKDRFLYANPAAETIFGYTPVEMLQRTFTGLVHPDSLPLITERYSAWLRGKPVPTRAELKIVTKSGAPRWIESAGESITIDGMLCYLSTILDITERREAEEALQASEAKFRALAETSQAAILIFDNTQFVYANPACKQLFGYTPAELSKCAIWDLLHPDSRAIAKQRYVARLRGAPVATRNEIKTRTKTGAARWVDYSLGQIEFGGQPYRIVMAFDITERKQAEEELRVSEERFAAAFNASPDAMAITTFEEGRFVLVNDAWVGVFGISRAAALGQQYQNLSIWVDEAQRNYVFKQVRSTGSVVDYEANGRTAKGQTRTFLTTAKLIKLGAETFVLSVSRDITERKRVEVELQTSQAQLRNLAGRLQTIREEERTAIAREIHDELGQALTGIKMDLKWLEQLLPPEAEPARERLTSIYGLIGNTVQGVRQLATSLRPGVLDDFGLAAALEWQARDFTARTGIACGFEELPEELPLEPAQATALFRIFQETLTNVARHAEASQINARLSYENNSLCLQIHDNGKGITANEIEHNRSLGLVGMRERALLLGGTFSIAGSPGAGTTITVQIPLTTHLEPTPKIPTSTNGEHA